MLAGHSFRGLYAFTFAARYPEEVAGMVLVDSTAPASAATQATSPGDRDSYDITGRVSALLSSSASSAVHGHHRHLLVRHRRPPAPRRPSRASPSPWYRDEAQPSVADMLATLRRVIITAQFRGTDPEPATPEEINICDWPGRTPPHNGESRFS